MKSQIPRLELSRREQLLSFQNLLSQHYLAVCESSDTLEIYQKIKDTMKIVQVQHSSKIMSTRDFLKFQALEISVYNKLQLLQQQISLSEISLFAFGNEVTNSLRGSLKQGFDCKNFSEGLVNLKLASRETLTGQLGRSPDLAVFEYSRKLIDGDQKSISLNELPELSGFASVSSIKRSVGSSITNYQLGLFFRYEFDGGYFESERKTNLERQLLADLQKREVMLSRQADIAENYQKMQLIAKNYQGYKLARENTERLLKLIETQQDLNILDPTTSTQAYLESINQSKAMRSAWADHLMAQMKLIEYEKSFRSPTGLEDSGEEKK